MPDKDKTREQLIDDERRYRDLFENAPDMYFTVDSETATIVECNRALSSELRSPIEDLVGRSVFDLYHPECLEDVAKVFQAFQETGEVRDAELRVVGGDGSAIDVVLSASAVRDENGKIVQSRSMWRNVSGSRRNERELREAKDELERRVTERTEELLEANQDLHKQVSERIAAEEALRHAQKMESMGRMTGGLAHDLNNLLTVIRTNASLIADELPPGAERHRAELGDVLNATRQGMSLVEKLLMFGRRSKLELKPVDLAEVILSHTKTLRRVLPETIEIDVSANDGPLDIEADSDAIYQIVMNLANNARDAMSQAGHLEIAARRVYLDEETARRRGGEQPGDYAELFIADNGSGMDEETRARVFEPFFTTKGPGQGTGLGMAIIYGLVKQQKGFVQVDSVVGEGTRVSTYFPVVTEAAVSPPPEQEERAPRGRETILLIEDEETLRRAGQRVLERYGYSVLLGTDGEHGLEVFRENEDRIALVITDVVMPKKSGPEVCDEIRRTTQEVRFIYTSGYSANDVSSSVPMDPSIPFVSKPWALSALVALVREILDEVRA